MAHEPIPLNVRIEDGSFNNRAPIGACAFFDPSDRSLVRGRAYVVLHDGHIMIRRYQAPTSLGTGQQGTLSLVRPP
jgi:hypothetical protein